MTADRLRLELFGCMAGAHPSIPKHRLGWLEAARGSTILLDEADQLDLELQRLLFEAVERGRFWRIGGAEPIDLDVRILATASRDPHDPGDHAFHPGFAERIGCFTIVVPPLRERLDDLPSLIDETLSLIQSRSGGARKRLDAAAYRALVDHRWPGNLRELTTALECASLASPGDFIGMEHLPPLRDAEGSARGQLSALRSEKEWLLDGLRRNRFRRGCTADYLGISRKTLYNKMRAQGLLPGALDESAPTPKARGPSADRPEAGRAES